MLSCRISSADNSSQFMKCYFEGDHLVPLTAQLSAPLNGWTQRIISQANCTDVQQGCFWAQGLPYSISEPPLAKLFLLLGMLITDNISIPSVVSFLQDSLGSKPSTRICSSAKQSCTGTTASSLRFASLVTLQRISLVTRPLIVT